MTINICLMMMIDDKNICVQIFVINGGYFFGGDPSLPEAVVNILPPKSNLSLASHLSLSLSWSIAVESTPRAVHVQINYDTTIYSPSRWLLFVYKNYKINKLFLISKWLKKITHTPEIMCFESSLFQYWLYKK